MPISRIARVGRVARAGQGGLTILGNPHSILTITDNGSGAGRVTTAAPHGLTGGELVTISGTSQASYNDAGNQVDSVTTPTTFDSGDLAYVGDSIGGTWAIT